ncbi:MAG: hypothetical protein DMF64_04370 [Acidobacteria bacterium]|nr:MAG: hypothetical protein DMF64_04370 [Acidobacteriota bacterium]
MARNQTRRIAPAILQADREALQALKGMGDNYKPANPVYTVEQLQTLQQQMDAKQETETQKAADAAAARDEAAAGEWDFHNGMLGVKEQVIAQHGKDSAQVQALGLKRKSEYQAPKRKGKTNGGGK